MLLDCGADPWLADHCLHLAVELPTAKCAPPRCCASSEFVAFRATKVMIDQKPEAAWVSCVADDLVEMTRGRAGVKEARDAACTCGCSQGEVRKLDGVVRVTAVPL